MARTFDAKKEIMRLSDRRVANLNEPDHSPEFIQIMSELGDVTNGYTSMLQVAQKAHTSLSRMASAREDLSGFEKRLDALCIPIRNLTDSTERVVANVRMTALYNAVCSSLNALTRFS